MRFERSDYALATKLSIIFFTVLVEIGGFRQRDGCFPEAWIGIHEKAPPFVSSPVYGGGGPPRKRHDGEDVLAVLSIVAACSGS